MIGSHTPWACMDSATGTAGGWEEMESGGEGPSSDRLPHGRFPSRPSCSPAWKENAYRPYSYAPREVGRARGSGRQAVLLALFLLAAPGSLLPSAQHRFSLRAALPQGSASGFQDLPTLFLQGWGSNSPAVTVLRIPPSCPHPCPSLNSTATALSSVWLRFLLGP